MRPNIMPHHRTDRDTATARVLLTRGHKLRADVLAAHKAAWTSDTVHHLIRSLSERELTCLMIVAQIGAARHDQNDLWLRDICDREQDRRDLRTNTQEQAA